MHWPTHAYIPGVNARHPESAFEFVKASVNDSMSVVELAQCSAFQHGFRYLQNGYYWEAHEVFEPVWMVLPEGSDERVFVQALIQVANAHLKLAMKRPKACLRLCDLSKNLLTKNDVRALMGVDVAIIREMVERLEAKIA